MIGFIAYYMNEEAKQIFIPLICVDEQYQQTGIGTEMFLRLQAVAQDADNGYQSIGLEVNKTNDKAYRFYVKHGFTEQEDRGRKLLMIKRL